LDLDNLTPDMLRQGLALYLRDAFPDGLPDDLRPLGRLQAEGTLPEILANSAFLPISLVEDDASRPDIYRLAIGSVDSTRVKLCLKRVSLSEDFIFNVDIHDLYSNRPDGAETEEEHRERKASEALKRKVEDAWSTAGLPTFISYMEAYLDSREGG
jgi:hypothetical protein